MPSPNMNLTIPSVGVTGGAIAAANLVTDLNLVDAHDHTPGNGALITPAGLNINSDLSFNSHNLTDINTTRFTNLSSAISSSAPNVGCLYAVNGDLYYNDASGNQIRMTAAGSVNAGAGSIGGLPSGTANVTYAAPTYTFQSATNTAANLDARNITLRNSAASSSGLTLTAPTLSTDKTLTLPLPPATTKFVTMTSTGLMETVVGWDASTINVIGNLLTVPTGGITTTQIATNTIVNANVSPSAAIAYSKLNLANSIVSADISSASPIVTNKLGACNSTSGTITTGVYGASQNLITLNLAGATSRPAYISFQGLSGYFRFLSGGAVTDSGRLAIYVGGVLTHAYTFTNTAGIVAPDAFGTLECGLMGCVTILGGAGSQTYTVTWDRLVGTPSIEVAGTVAMFVTNP